MSKKQTMRLSLITAAVLVVLLCLVGVFALNVSPTAASATDWDTSIAIADGAIEATNLEYGITARDYLRAISDAATESIARGKWGSTTIANFYTNYNGSVSAVLFAVTYDGETYALDYNTRICGYTDGDPQGGYPNDDPDYVLESGEHYGVDLDWGAYGSYESGYASILLSVGKKHLTADFSAGIDGAHYYNLFTQENWYSSGWLEKAKENDDVAAKWNHASGVLNAQSNVGTYTGLYVELEGEDADKYDLDVTYPEDPEHPGEPTSEIPSITIQQATLSVASWRYGEVSLELGTEFNSVDYTGSDDAFVATSNLGNLDPLTITWTTGYELAHGDQLSITDFAQFNENLTEGYPINANYNDGFKYFGLVTVDATDNHTGLTNYILGGVTINRREVGVSWQDASLEYNGGPQFPRYEFDLAYGGQKNADITTPPQVTESGEGTDIGDYNATLNLGEGMNKNYVFATGANMTEFSIIKGTVGVTISLKDDNKHFYYRQDPGAYADIFNVVIDHTGDENTDFQVDPNSWMVAKFLDDIMVESNSAFSSLADKDWHPSDSTYTYKVAVGTKYSTYVLATGPKDAGTTYYVSDGAGGYEAVIPGEGVYGGTLDNTDNFDDNDIFYVPYESPYYWNEDNEWFEIILEPAPVYVRSTADLTYNGLEQKPQASDYKYYIYAVDDDNEWDEIFDDWYVKCLGDSVATDSLTYYQFDGANYTLMDPQPEAGQPTNGLYFSADLVLNAATLTDAGTNAGDYAIAAELYAGSTWHTDYQLILGNADPEAVFTINPAEVTAIITDELDVENALVFNGAAKTISAKYQKFNAYGNPEPQNDATGVVTVAALGDNTNVTGAGFKFRLSISDANFKLVAIGGENPLYEEIGVATTICGVEVEAGAFVTTTLRHITPCPVAVTLNKGDLVYSGTEKTISGTYEDVKGDDIGAIVNLAENADNINAGNFGVIITIEDGNYAIANGEGYTVNDGKGNATITITKAPLEVVFALSNGTSSVVGYTQTYDGKRYTISASATGVNNEVITFATTAWQKDVGSTSLTIEAGDYKAVGEETYANYNLASDATSTTLEITARAISVNVSGNSSTYGDAIATPSVSIVSDQKTVGYGTEDAEIPWGTTDEFNALTSETTVADGTGVTIFENKSGNYNITFLSGNTYSINKRSITVVFVNDSLTKVYDGDPITPEVTEYTGKVNNDVLEIEKVGGNFVGVRTNDDYQFELTGAKASNYSLTKDTVKVTIQQRPVTWALKIDDQSKDTVTYQGSSYTFKADITNRVGSEDISLTIAGFASQVGTDAGEYKYTLAMTGDACTNYSLASGTKVTFTISKKPIELSYKYDDERTYVYNDEAGFTTAKDGSWLNCIDLSDSLCNDDTIGSFVNVAFYKDKDKDGDAVELAKNTNVGKYYFFVSEKATSNYEFTFSINSAEKAYVEVTKGQALVTAPTGATELVFDGSAKSLLKTNGSTTLGTLEYKVDEGGWTSNVEDVIATAAKDSYKVSYRVVGTDNFDGDTDEDNYFSVVIAKRAVAVTLAGDITAENLVYTGAAKTVTGTYYIWENGAVSENTAAAKITLTSEEGTNVNAGNFTVSISIADGNYTVSGETSATYTISALPVAVTLSETGNVYNNPHRFYYNGLHKAGNNITATYTTVNATTANASLEVIGTQGENSDLHFTNNPFYYKITIADPNYTVAEGENYEYKTVSGKTGYITIAYNIVRKNIPNTQIEWRYDDGDEVVGDDDTNAPVYDGKTHSVRIVVKATAFTEAERDCYEAWYNALDDKDGVPATLEASFGAVLNNGNAANTGITDGGSSSAAGTHTATLTKPTNIVTGGFYDYQYTGFDTETKTWYIKKAPTTISTAVALATGTIVYDGEAKTLLTAGSATEGTGTMVFGYSIGNAEFQPENATWYTLAQFPTQTNAAAYHVWYKVEATDNYAGIVATEVGVVYINQATDTALTTDIALASVTYTGSAQQLITTAGAAKYGATVLYRIGSTGDGTDDATAITATDKGDYDVYYKIEGTTNYVGTEWTKAGTAKINAADATLTAPTKINNLVYDGTAQTLANAGTATGGTLQYSTDGETFGDAIPTGTDADTYTIYYRVKGDSNHNDLEDESYTFTVVIKQRGIKVVFKAPTADIYYTGVTLDMYDYLQLDTAANYDFVDGDTMKSIVTTVNVRNGNQEAVALDNVIAAGSYSFTGVGTNNANYNVKYAFNAEVVTINAKPVTIGYSYVPFSSVTYVAASYNYEYTLTTAANNLIDNKYYLTGAVAGDNVLDLVTVALKNEKGEPITVSAESFNALPAGTYTYYVTAKENANYSIQNEVANGALVLNNNALAKLVIGKQTVTVDKTQFSIVGVNKAYDGTTTATLDSTNAVILGNVKTGDKLGVTATGAFRDANVGANKPIDITSLTLTGDDAGNYELLADTAQQQNNQKVAYADITKATAVITGVTGAANLVYNFDDQELLADAGSTTFGEIEYSLDEEEEDWETDVAKITADDAGTYYVYYRVVGTDNYNGADGNVKVDIAQKTIVVSATADGKTYDGTTAVTFSNIVAGGRIDQYDDDEDLYVVIEGAFENANAEDGKTVTITKVELKGDSAGNYVLSTEEGVRKDSTLTANIAKKNIAGATITLDDKVLTYNGEEQTKDVVSVYVDELEVSPYIYDGNKATDAGEYTLTVEGAGNFTGTATKAWSIARAGITPYITLDNVPANGNDATKVYDGQAHTFAVVAAGADETVEIYTASSTNVFEGSYEIAADTAVGDNYVVETAAKFTWEITARPITVTYEGSVKEMTYGDTATAWETLEEEMLTHLLYLVTEDAVANAEQGGIAAILEPYFNTEADGTGTDYDNFEALYDAPAGIYYMILDCYNTNYTVTADLGDKAYLQIRQAELTLGLSVSGKTYDGTAIVAPTFGHGIAVSGWKHDDTAELIGENNVMVMYAPVGDTESYEDVDDNDWSITAPITAGDYYVAAAVGGLDNYDTAYEVKVVTIEKASLSVNYTYEGDFEYGTFAALSEGNGFTISGWKGDDTNELLTAETFTITYCVKTKSDFFDQNQDTATEWSTTALTDAGRYYVRVYFKGLENYRNAAWGREYTITKKAITPALYVDGVAVNGNDATKVYDGQEHVFVVKALGAGSEIITLAEETITDAENVEVSFTAGNYAADDKDVENYVLAADAAFTYSITKKPIEEVIFKLDGAVKNSVEYDGNNHGVVAYATGVDGELFGIGGGAGKEAGSYTVTVAAGSYNDNYSLAEAATFTWSIVEKAAVVDPDTGVATYEKDIPLADATSESGSDVTALFKKAAADTAEAKEIKVKVGEDTTIVFDAAAISQLSAATNVSMKVNVISDAAAISAAAKEALRSGEMIIEVSLGGINFETGKATVSVPFDKAVPDGMVGKVYYVDENGNKTDMNAKFEDGKVTFETNHFSDYIVVFEKAGGLGAGAIAGIVIGCVVGVAGIAVLIFFLLKKKKGGKAGPSETVASEAAEQA